MSKKTKGKKSQKIAVDEKIAKEDLIQKFVDGKVAEKDLDKYLIGLVIGIQFRPNFSIEDKIGKITDEILYDDKSFFNPNVFPHVQNDVGKKTLLNYETGDNLLIKNTDFVLTVNLDHNKLKGFNVDDCETIINNFQKQVLKKTMCKFGISQISRVGIIKKYAFPLEKLAKTFADKTVGSTLGGVNNINLNFSKKEPMPKSVAQKKVSDYCNVIFNIIKPPKHELNISIDYQWYYDPFLEKSNDIQFTTFVKEAKKFIKNKFLPWLNDNYIQEEKS